MPEKQADKQAKPIAQDVLVSIQVPISAADYAYLEANAGGKTPSEKLAAYTKWFISRQARGGLMLEPEDCDYLARINKDTRFGTSKDVVRAVESAFKRHEGAMYVPCKVDVENEESIKQQAEFNGCTVEDLLTQCANEVMVNSWWAEFTPANGCNAPFSEKDTATARRALGKHHFTGADIGPALERLEALEKGDKAKAA